MLKLDLNKKKSELARENFSTGLFIVEKFSIFSNFTGTARVVMRRVTSYYNLKSKRLFPINFFELNSILVFLQEGVTLLLFIYFFDFVNLIKNIFLINFFLLFFLFKICFCKVVSCKKVGSRTRIRTVNDIKWKSCLVCRKR